MSSGASRKMTVDEVVAEMVRLREENKRLLAALYHAVYRTHQHSDNCSGCAEVSRAFSGGDRGD